MRSRDLSAQLLRVLLVLLPVETPAWGAQGHQVVANLAEEQLMPQARQEVKRLLALEPGQTLAAISTLAYGHAPPPEPGGISSNFPRDICTYDAAGAFRYHPLTLHATRYPGALTTLNATRSAYPQNS